MAGVSIRTIAPRTDAPSPAESRGRMEVVRKRPDDPDQGVHAAR
jgi:hypothetical protein